MIRISGSNAATSSLVSAKVVDVESLKVDAELTREYTIQLPNPYSILRDFDKWYRWEYRRIVDNVQAVVTFSVLPSRMPSHLLHDVLRLPRA